MKRVFTFILVCLVFSLSAVTIYQIQYTLNPGRDNTYPSPYLGKIVTVEGIVTAIGYKAGGFFLSEPGGGPWRGIFVQTNVYHVQPGDKVILKGKVGEYYGMTRIYDVNALSILDSNRNIPFAIPVATGQITSADQAEAYEGTLVKVLNTTYIQGNVSGAHYFVNDGSGICQISDAFFTEKTLLYRNNEVFASLTGIVCYAYGSYSINPRNRSDITVMAPVFNQNRSWGRIKSIYK